MIGINQLRLSATQPRVAQPHRQVSGWSQCICEFSPLRSASSSRLLLATATCASCESTYSRITSRLMESYQICQYSKPLMGKLKIRMCSYS